MHDPGARSNPAEEGPPARAGRISSDEFATAFEESARVLWTIAAAELGDRSHAQDVLQEAALIGLQKLDQFVPGTSFRAWLGRIVTFVARNHARRDHRRRTYTVDPETLDASRPAPRAVDSDPLAVLGADAGHFDDELCAALAGLRPVVRASLLLRAVLDLEYQEIATWLDIPTGTAVSHVHRARGQLRVLLADRRLPMRKP